MNHRKILHLSKSGINLNKVIGDYGELYVCYEFLKRNYEIFKNTSEDQTDLLLLGGGSKKIRIQVKTSNLHSSSFYSFGVANGKHRYEKIDYFIFLGIKDDLSVNVAWIIPREIFKNYKSSNVGISLNSKRYKKYKNNWKINLG